MSHNFDFTKKAVKIHSFEQKKEVLEYAQEDGYSISGIFPDSWETHDIIGCDLNYCDEQMNGWNHNHCPFSEAHIIDFEIWRQEIFGDMTDRLDFSALNTLL